MKKTFLFLFAIGALILSACSDDDKKDQDYTYMTISGNWDLHRTSSTGTDSVVSDPVRMIQMTWSDMEYNDTIKQEVISSQVTIGNGTFYLYSYINGSTPGDYTMTDKSYALYKYNTLDNDSVKFVRYSLSGTLNWETKSAHSAIITLDAKALELTDTTSTDSTDRIVSFVGPMKTDIE